MTSIDLAVRFLFSAQLVSYISPTDGKKGQWQLKRQESTPTVFSLETVLDLVFYLGNQIVLEIGEMRT